MTTLAILDKSVHILDNLYSLNDLHKAAGSEEKHKPANFMRLDQTQELVKEICTENNRCSDVSIAYKTFKGGLKQGTFVCRELVYAYAMWISAKFHLLVIRAFDAMYSQPQPVPQIPRAVITPEQKSALLAIVDRRVNGFDSLRGGLWKRHNNHFNINSYHELLAVHFDDAR